MGVQKHHKKNCKKSCRKAFTKKSTKKPKPIFSDFVYHLFGRFSVKGVLKYCKKGIKQINLTLVFLLPLTHPPTTGVTDFLLLLPAPWGGKWRRRSFCTSDGDCFAYNCFGALEIALVKQRLDLKPQTAGRRK
jgi:hypothetical protein